MITYRGNGRLSNNSNSINKHNINNKDNNLNNNNLTKNKLTIKWDSGNDRIIRIRKWYK